MYVRTCLRENHVSHANYLHTMHTQGYNTSDYCVEHSHTIGVYKVWSRLGSSEATEVLTKEQSLLLGLVVIA